MVVAVALVAAAGPGPARAQSADWLADGWCSPATGRTTDDLANAVTAAPHIKVIYAHASDDLDRFATYAGYIQQRVKAAAQAVIDNSGGGPVRKSLRFDQGIECNAAPAPQYLDIQTVHLPDERADYIDNNDFIHFARIVNDVRDAVGPAPGPRNYLVWADRLRNPFFGFEGSANDLSTTMMFGVPTDADNPDPAQNPASDGGYFAVLYGYQATAQDPNLWAPETDARVTYVVAHELFHILGAVLDNAPHAAPGGHCDDDAEDLLCHDGGNACVGNTTEAITIDCNRDDYFDPAGAITTTGGKPIWNTYDSLFLCPLGRCLNQPPAPALSVDPAKPPARTKVTLSAAASSDDGAISAYAWDRDGDGNFEHETGAKPTTIATYGSPGPRTVAVRVADDEGIARTATASFTVGEAPAVTELRLRPDEFRPARSGGPVIKRGGARVEMRLTAPTEVAFRVERERRDRAGRGRCAAPSRPVEGTTRCARLRRPLGSFRLELPAGRSAFRFSGRLGGKALAPGRYRLLASPGPKGTRKPPAQEGFRILGKR